MAHWDGTQFFINHHDGGDLESEDDMWVSQPYRLHLHYQHNRQLESHGKAHPIFLVNKKKSFVEHVSNATPPPVSISSAIEATHPRHEEQGFYLNLAREK